MACECGDRQAVIDVVNLYATCLDAGDLDGLDAVFTAEVAARYVGHDIAGRAALVEAIAATLHTSGPTQHLLGNHVVRLVGDTAESVCQARVLRIRPRPEAAPEPLELVGEYRDELIRTAAGWRIVSRVFQDRIHLGTASAVAGRRPTSAPQESLHVIHTGADGHPRHPQ